MRKLLIICGPTATGKTDLGIFMAKKYSGEIISADSRQVYKGMDIITGKDLPVYSHLEVQNSKLNIKNNNFSVGFRIRDGIPIWLVDIVYPDYMFNVGEYKYLAGRVMENIWLRNKLPIIVGGSGLYIKSLIEPMADVSIPPDIYLRKQLKNWSREDLIAYLKQINLSKWSKMNKDDRLNPRRLIRAVEISLAREKSRLDCKNKRENKKDRVNNYAKYVLSIGFWTSTDKLYRIIDKRVEMRLRNGLAEVRRLYVQGYNAINSVIGSTIGYKELGLFIDKKISLEEATDKWKYSEHGYARRQLIWFKKQQGIKWFDISNKNYINEIENSVTKWYTDYQ